MKQNNCNDRTRPVSYEQNLRSSSPTTFKLYLPSDQMQPHRAISMEDLSRLKESLQDEDDLRLDLRNSDGLLPLEHAIQRKYTEGIKVLLSHGANPAITCEETISNGFHHAASHGNEEIVRMIMIHAIFPHITKDLNRAVQEMDKVQAQNATWRAKFILAETEKLVTQHVKQLEMLVTQVNKAGLTPEKLASQNPNVCGLFTVSRLKEYYGDGISSRYVTELQMAYAQTLDHQESE